MRLQHERRHNPYPLTWEIPVLTLALLLFAAAGAVHVGRALALLFGTGTWAMTPRGDLFAAVPDIVAGDANAALATSVGAVSVQTLWVWLVATELITAVAAAWALRAIWARWGAHRLHGTARWPEVEQLLGVSRLRKNAAVSRPDLVGRRRDFDPRDVGWRVGTAAEPRTGKEVWVPWDRTTGVIGPQGSGKTLDLLLPALLAAPGAALVTLTKVTDLLLSIDARASEGRPVLVLDPFGLAPGLPELIFDPIDGCVDPMIAERRAKAFTAGTVQGAVSGGYGDGAARFYAAEAAKVVQCYFHAAALAGYRLDRVLEWVADPRGSGEPRDILTNHPHAAPFWHRLLDGALRGDDRTAGNTTATVQQAMSLFFQADIRKRCAPSEGRPATNVEDVIALGGTIYLLGREDPYASASPLMTAVAEHVCDSALNVANRSPHGRLCPPMLACLDELPSTAPLPTLRTRMANERALGLAFIYAAQTWRQLAAIFGEQEARALFGLTNVLCMFGGSKDVGFNQEISDLLGPVRVTRHSWHGRGQGRSTHSDDIPILTGAEVRQMPERHALVVAENGRPIVAKLNRCIDGQAGRRLLQAQTTARERIEQSRRHTVDVGARTTAALVESRHRGLSGWN